MRRVLLFVALLFVAPSLASAQVPDFPNGCDKCVVFAYADHLEPADVPVVSLTADWRIDGWGFECSGGAPIDRVDVWYWVASPRFAEGGAWEPAGGTYALTYGDRPDTRAAFRAHCPAMGSDVGFSATYDPVRIPRGVHHIRLVFWRGPLKTHQHYRIRFQ